MLCGNKRAVLLSTDTERPCNFTTAEPALFSAHYITRRHNTVQIDPTRERCVLQERAYNLFAVYTNNSCNILCHYFVRYS